MKSYIFICGCLLPEMQRSSTPTNVKFHNRTGITRHGYEVSDFPRHRKVQVVVEVGVGEVHTCSKPALPPLSLPTLVRADIEDNNLQNYSEMSYNIV